VLPRFSIGTVCCIVYSDGIIEVHCVFHKNYMQSCEVVVFTGTFDA
jgi:hypothetical protein